jgi:ABC-type dipeptide/oligopeptide/nickel transport system permease component
VALPVLLGVTMVTFILTRVLPGSPIDQIAGPMSTPAQRQALAAHYGLDRPLWQQYAAYIGGLVRGDLGASFTTSRPVASDLAEFFPATMELMTAAIVIATLIGVPLGVWGAVRQGTWVDHVVRLVAVAGVALPIFWLSLVLIYLFFYTWHLLPAPMGRLNPRITPPPQMTGFLLVDSLLARNGVAFADAARQLVLPVAVLAFAAVAPLARITRTSMLDVLSSAHVRATLAFGIPWRSVVWTYALRNAMLPVLTMLAIVYGYLLGGSVLVETLFAWPGLGRYAFNAISGNDYPAVEGFILYATAVYLAIFIIVDVLYVILDPRVQA